MAPECDFYGWPQLGIEGKAWFYPRPTGNDVVIETCYAKGDYFRLWSCKLKTLFVAARNCMAIRLVGRKHWSADRKKKKIVPSVGMAVQFYKELQVGCLCLADEDNSKR